MKWSMDNYTYTKRVTVNPIVESLDETVKRLLRNHSMKDVLESIGIDKIQSYLRKEKIKNIRDNKKGQ